MANFIECNREQQYLLPPALQDWLPPKDLAWLIIDAVDAMDLSAFYRRGIEIAVHASAPTLQGSGVGQAKVSF